MQAVQRGCIPLVPDRLCYSEFYANKYRYNSADGDPAVEGYSIASKLCDMLETGVPQPPDLGYLGWREMAPRYRDTLLATAAGENND